MKQAAGAALSDSVCVGLVLPLAGRFPSFNGDQFAPLTGRVSSDERGGSRMSGL